MFYMYSLDRVGFCFVRQSENIFHLVGELCLLIDRTDVFVLRFVILFYVTVTMSYYVLYLYFSPLLVFRLYFSSSVYLYTNTLMLVFLVFLFPFLKMYASAFDLLPLKLSSDFYLLYSRQSKKSPFFSQYF